MTSSLYFNNAGAGIMSEDTFRVVARHMRKEMEVGGYAAADEARGDVEGFYRAAAALVNAADASEIAFCDNASRGWNLVVNSLGLSSGDRIVTLQSEYGTNLIVLYDYARKVGASLDIVACDEVGHFDLLEVRSLLDAGAKTVAVSHVAAHGPIVNPIEELGSMCREYGATLIVDGCQAVGQLPVDVRSMNCDAYVASGRKWLRGPRGTGFVYARAGAPLCYSQLDLASADLVLKDSKITDIKVVGTAKRFELWEKNVASLLGFKNAINECLSMGINAISDRIVSKADVIRSAVEANSKLRLAGSLSSRSGVVGFYCIDPSDEAELSLVFESKGFAFSKMCDWDCPLHFPKNGVKYIFRFSPHFYTSDEDVDTLCRTFGEF